MTRHVSVTLMAAVNPSLPPSHHYPLLLFILYYPILMHTLPLFLVLMIRKPFPLFLNFFSFHFSTMLFHIPLVMMMALPPPLPPARDGMRAESEY